MAGLVRSSDLDAVRNFLVGVDLNFQFCSLFRAPNGFGNCIVVRLCDAPMVALKSSTTFESASRCAAPQTVATTKATSNSATPNRDACPYSVRAGLPW